jgi:hypothetical protein
MELKLGLSKIMLQHSFEVCEKTDVRNPVVYNKNTTLLQPEKGFWLNIKPVSEE